MGLWPFARARPERTSRRTAAPSLKRERRSLAREREQLIRDLGGIVYEMFRLDRFRVETVTERCRALAAIDERIGEIDELVAASTRRGPKCACGAPIPWGAHFCQNCGRAVGPQPVVSCARCGTPLPADVQFCGACGSPVDATPEPAAEVPADTQPGIEEPDAVPAATSRDS